MITIKGTEALGDKILKYNVGQRDALYIVGCNFVSGREVDARWVAEALNVIGKILPKGKRDLYARIEKLLKLKPSDEGCIFDSARGIYMGESVIRLAQDYGFSFGEEDEPNTKADGEYYMELWEE